MFKLRAVNNTNALIMEQNILNFEEVKVKAKEFNNMGLFVFIYNEKQLKYVDENDIMSYKAPSKEEMI